MVSAHADSDYTHMRHSCKRFIKNRVDSQSSYAIYMVSAHAVYHSGCVLFLEGRGGELVKNSLACAGCNQDDARI